MVYYSTTCCKVRSGRWRRTRRKLSLPPEKGSGVRRSGTPSRKASPRSARGAWKFWGAPRERLVSARAGLPRTLQAPTCKQQRSPHTCTRTTHDALYDASPTCKPTRTRTHPHPRTTSAVHSPRGTKPTKEASSKRREEKGRRGEGMERGWRGEDRTGQK